MDFYVTFHIVTYLLILVGLGATLLADALPLYAQIIAAAFATICFVLRLKGVNPAIPRGFKNVLSVVVIFFLIADIYFLPSTLLQASIKFLVLIEVLKFFDLNKNRDYFQLYTIIFFQVISATARTSSVAFFPILIIFTVLLIWAMILFHLKREGEKNLAPLNYSTLSSSDVNSDKTGAIPKGIITPKFLFMTAMLSVISLLTTMFIFFMTPRLGVSMLQRGFSEGVRLSGFSETVNLGEIGRVKLDPAVVMRVELPDVKNPLRLSLYWRGRAFEHFDGFRWSQKESIRSPLKKNVDGVFMTNESVIFNRDTSVKSYRDDQFSGRSMDKQNDKVELIKQKITLEPLVTEVLFAASFGSGISGNLFWPSRDEMGNIYLPRSSFKGLEYTAYSTLSPSEDFQKPFNRNKYLQLFERDGRIKELAGSITSGIDSDEEKAKAVYDYLIENYQYNLNSPWEGEGNPLEAFLLDVKEGYCEQFATSMAILLRHAGVPTRLVTGFLRGEWNKYGNYFLVRNKNAHAWVEVYLESKGWTTFDPTPPVEIGKSFIASPVSLFFDSFSRQWKRYVVQYSFGDQISMAHSLKSRTVNINDGLKDLSASIVRRLKGLARLSFVNIGAGSLLIFIVTGFIYMLRKKRWVDRVRGGELLKRGLDFYVKMLWILEKKGIKKSENITPGEFAMQTVSAYGEDLQGVLEITDRYHKVRFGGAGIDRKERQYIKEILDRLDRMRIKTIPGENKQ